MAFVEQQAKTSFKDAHIQPARLHDMYLNFAEQLHILQERV